MLKSDQVLWEQELADHMRLHGADLLGLPPVGGSGRRGRLWRRALWLWTPVAVVSSAIGWSVGWYLI